MIGSAWKVAVPVVGVGLLALLVLGGERGAPDAVAAEKARGAAGEAAAEGQEAEEEPGFFITHYNNAAINYEHAVDERGETVSSGARGDPVTRHDILTGSRLDGTAFPPDEDRTCRNWTSGGDGSAQVGHHDRYRFQTFGSPWNSAHPSRGCGQEALESTGGAGLFYCFAAE